MDELDEGQERRAGTIAVLAAILHIPRNMGGNMIDEVALVDDATALLDTARKSVAAKSVEE